MADNLDPIERLRAADPLAGQGRPGAANHVFGRVLAGLDRPAVEPGQLHARGRRLALIAASLVLAVFTGGAAVAYGPDIIRTVFLDETDIPAEIERTRKLTPLPPGETWDPVNYGPDGPDGTVYEVGVFTNQLQFQAQCKWYAYWRDGHNRGDGSQTTIAIEGISQIPDWWMYREGIDDESRRRTDQILAGVERGDPTALDAYVSANCGGVLDAPDTP